MFFAEIIFEIKKGDEGLWERQKMTVCERQRVRTSVYARRLAHTRCVCVMMMMLMLYLFKEFSKESYKKEALLCPCVGSIKT